MAYTVHMVEYKSLKRSVQSVTFVTILTRTIAQMFSYPRILEYICLNVCILRHRGPKKSNHLSHDVLVYPDMSPEGIPHICQ